MRSTKTAPKGAVVAELSKTKESKAGEFTLMAPKR